MSYIEHFDLAEVPLYFAYRRTSQDREQFQGTFHAHQGVEILLVHEGQGTLILNRHQYEVKTGMICVFQPYQLHQVRMDMDPSRPFVRSIVHFEPATYEHYFDKWPTLLGFFHYLSKGKLPSPCRYEQFELDRLTSDLVSLQEKSAPMPREQILEEHSLFLVAFLRAFKSLWEARHRKSGSIEIRKPHQAERMMEWLETRYAEPLSLDAMSKDLHLSPHHLSHLFKECTGSSISDYLTVKRMQHAVHLLASSDHSVARIGEEVGLSNCSHFCKQFKKHFGLTPYRFRKQSPMLVPDVASADGG
ncbi:helix-turn-helix domain-containing protein [Cohnella suwonensis]|uniref:Helix-turn-helix domain-containing protein n=1 Tax=Cohnella suwonensis TaxID=696072 RepID=A0ABW0LZA4_9BACL